MRRLLLSAALFAARAPTQALAVGSTVNALTTSPAIVGGQLFYCPIGVTNDYKCTAAQVAAFNYSLMSGDCTANSAGTVTCTKINGVTLGPLATVTPGAGVQAAVGVATNASGGMSLVSGAMTTNDCLKWGPGIVDAGAACGAGGGGTPGGSSAQVQYNNAGAFGGFTVGGDAALNTSTGALTVTKTNGVSFASLATTVPGTGVPTALTTNVGTAGSFVTNGGGLGTPSSGTLTNATSLPISTGVSGLGAGVPAALAVTSNASGGMPLVNGAMTSGDCLKWAAGGVTDAGAACGSGGGGGTPGGTSGQIQYNNAAAFGGFTVGGDGTLNTGTGALTVTKTNGTALTALATTPPGTGVTSAVAANVGSAGSVVVNGGALGTPSSGTLTNAAGLPILTGVSGMGAGVPAALTVALNASGGVPAVSGAITAGNLIVGAAGGGIKDGGPVPLAGGGGAGGGTGLPQTNLNYRINLTSATAVEAQALGAGNYIYVMSVSVQGPTGTASLEYGTGTTCGTGTVVLDTWMLNGSQEGKTGGPGPAYVIPAGNAMCLVTAGTITQVYGSIGYAISSQTPAVFAGGGNVFQATLFNAQSANSATTIQVIAPVAGQAIYLVNYSYQVDAAVASGQYGTFQIVSGTGTNCATINQRLTPVWDFSANNGIQEGSIGVLGQSSVGDALCVATTTANLVRWRIGVAQQ